jgi:RNA recognition motif-containing protein
MSLASAVEVDAEGNVPRRVYVGGMPFWYTEDDIRACWEECGPIESLTMLTFPDTGNFRGIVFITFETEEAFQAALAFSGDSVDGKTLQVKNCKAPAPRSRGGAADVGKARGLSDAAQGKRALHAPDCNGRTSPSSTFEGAKRRVMLCSRKPCRACLRPLLGSSSVCHVAL